MVTRIGDLLPLGQGVLLEKEETSIENHPRDGPRSCDSFDAS